MVNLKILESPLLRKSFNHLQILTVMIVDLKHSIISYEKSYLMDPQSDEFSEIDFRHFC